MVFDLRFQEKSHQLLAEMHKCVGRIVARPVTASDQTGDSELCGRLQEFFAVAVHDERRARRDGEGLECIVHNEGGNIG